jgi:uncharacterized cupin superfamily protein
VQLKVTDVELLKKQARKMAAGRVLAGAGASACRDLAQMEGCRVCISAGYGAASKAPQSTPHDRLIWILDGYAQVQTTNGQVTDVSQGESTVLTAGVAYRLTFPQLTIYLLVEGPEKD